MNMTTDILDDEIFDLFGLSLPPDARYCKSLLLRAEAPARESARYNVSHLGI